MLKPEQVDAALRILNSDEIAFRFIVKPGSKKEGFSVDAAGHLVVKVNAPALEGKANERVVELLSELLGCPKRDLNLAKGQTSRHKEIRIKNISLSELRERFLQAS